jgi:DNA-binding NarL/FixJ family response regulator
MPNMNGIKLSKKLLEINKDQKIIITSAYNDTEYMIDLINTGVSGFFQKPINDQNMFKVMHDVCSSFLGNSIISFDETYSFDFLKKKLYKEKKIKLSAVGVYKTLKPE